MICQRSHKHTVRKENMHCDYTPVRFSFSQLLFVILSMPKTRVLWLNTHLTSFVILVCRIKFCDSNINSFTANSENKCNLVFVAANPSANIFVFGLFSFVSCFLFHIAI